MMLDYLLQIVVLISCAAVLLVIEPSLNQITRVTNRRVRASLRLIAVGAVLTSASAIPGLMQTPWPGVAALSAGVALMLYSSRRRDVRYGRKAQ